MNDISSSQTAVRREPFVFTGRAGEYFGIWIVNVLLTILTLGIYSAWAKVRRQRYFYGNTWLAGANFEYHARPMQILIGRIIVLAMIAIYNITLQVAPVAGAVLFVALLFAIPWLLMRGLRFSARVTSYRNVRFDFTGGYGGAFLAFVLGGALVYGSAGILAPLASQWMWSYMLGNLRYGGRPVSCDPRLEKLYGQWWLPVLVLVGSIVVFGGLILVCVLLMIGADLGFGDATFSNIPPFMVLALFYAAIVPFIAAYFVAGLLYTAGTRNVAFNETVIDGRHMLHSAIGRWRYAWISISSILATVATLGLARPWAAIRMARYLAMVTALDATGSLDVYCSGLKSEGAAVGAEFMDVEGFDVGF